MRRYFTITLLAFVAQIAYAQEKTMTPEEFEKAAQSMDNEQIIDVRTPDEFAKGYIHGALNIDINGANFEEYVATLDKSKPVMVYCLSGGRSSRAVEYLKTQGFANISQLKGGMMQWNSAHKPVVVKSPPVPGMSTEDFYKQVDNGKIVLVDFYAKWCAPCKKLMPELEALTEENKDIMTLLKLNADESSTLIDALKVKALPAVFLFKDGKKVWSHFGVIDRASVESELKKYQ